MIWNELTIYILGAVVYSIAKNIKEGMEMTIKEFINQAMEIAKTALNNGDHEAYRRCMEIIADAIYEYQVA